MLGLGRGERRAARPRRRRPRSTSTALARGARRRRRAGDRDRQRRRGQRRRLRPDRRARRAGRASTTPGCTSTARSACSPRLAPESRAPGRGRRARRLDHRRRPQVAQRALRLRVRVRARAARGSAGRSTSARPTCPRPTTRGPTRASWRRRTRAGRARSPIWATLRAYGRDGYRAMVERHLRPGAPPRPSASTRARTWSGSPRCRSTSSASAYAPAGRRRGRSWTTLNRRLGEALLDDGRVFAGTTVYDGKVAFRPAIVNWRTTEADVDLLVDVLLELLEAKTMSAEATCRRRSEAARRARQRRLERPAILDAIVGHARRRTWRSRIHTAPRASLEGEADARHIGSIFETWPDTRFDERRPPAVAKGSSYRRPPPWPTPRSGSRPRDPRQRDAPAERPARPRRRAARSNLGRPIDVIPLRMPTARRARRTRYSDSANEVPHRRRSSASLPPRAGA